MRLSSCFDTLNEQCQLETGSDQNFLACQVRKVQDLQNKTTIFRKARFTDAFVVRHFAGEVCYVIQGFILKNTDTLSEQLKHFVIQNGEPLLMSIFRDGDEPEVSHDRPFSCAGEKTCVDLQDQNSPDKMDNIVRTRQNSANRLLGSSTVCKTFVEQMTSLSETLRATHISFVRCVRPNTQQMPRKWEADLVTRQLQNLGVLETVRIRQQGFPVRRGLAQFRKEFECLFRPPLWPCNPDPMDPKSEDHLRYEIKQVCQVQLSEDAWQIGRDKLFLKDNQLNILSIAISRAKDFAARLWQAQNRGVSARVRWRITRFAIIRIQCLLRTRLARKRAALVEQLRDAKNAAIFRAIKVARLAAVHAKAFAGSGATNTAIQVGSAAAIQAKLFALAASQAVLRLRSVMCLQARSRSRRQVKKFKERRTSVIQMQMLIRAKRLRRLLQRTRAAEQAIIILQSCIRARVQSQQFRHIKVSAMIVQSQIRHWLRRKAVLRAAVTWIQCIVRRRQATQHRHHILKHVRMLQAARRAFLTRRAIVDKMALAELEGSLEKRSIKGRFGFNWKKRTFRLRRKVASSENGPSNTSPGPFPGFTGWVLEYGKTEGKTSRFKVQKGEISIVAESEVKIVNDDVVPFAFVVRGMHDRGEFCDVYCAASSEEERQMWVKAIHLRCREAREASFFSRSSLKDLICARQFAITAHLPQNEKPARLRRASSLSNMNKSPSNGKGSSASPQRRRRRASTPSFFSSKS